MNGGKMMTANTAKVKGGRLVKIVSSESQENAISDRDAEMDARAKQAVKSAVAKAEFCKKPVAKYDKLLKKAYIEYADGEKKYVE